MWRQGPRDVRRRPGRFPRPGLTRQTKGACRPRPRRPRQSAQTSSRTRCQAYPFRSSLHCRSNLSCSCEHGPAFRSGGLAVTKLVYDFAEGRKDLSDLLGGKGANLAEMTRMGLPVPPGFVITTVACQAYLASGSQPDEMEAEVSEHLAVLEKTM